jgi:hypothetical protein
MSDWTWGVWVWTGAEQELCREQNGRVSWGKSRPNLQCCSAKQECCGTCGAVASVQCCCLLLVTWNCAFLNLLYSDLDRSERRSWRRWLRSRAIYHNITSTADFQRTIRTTLKLPSFSANYQNNTSAAELFSELSEQHFSCRVVQRTIRKTLKLPSCSANYQNNTSATEFFSELSEKTLQLLSCSTNYQKNTSAAELFNELSEQHFSCWVVQRTIRTTLKLPPFFFTSVWLRRIPSHPSCLSTCFKRRQHCIVRFISIWSPCWQSHSQFPFDFVLHSAHPWIFLSSKGNLSSSEP